MDLPTVVEWRARNANWQNFFYQNLMAKTVIAGLDIGTSAVRLVVCEWSESGRAPRVLAQAKRESRGLRRGYVVNLEEALQSVKEVIQEAERQAKIKVKRVILGIGGITLEAKTGEGQIAVSTADLEVRENDIERVGEASEANLGDFTNRKIIHNFALAFKLDGKKVIGRPEGWKGQKLEVKTLFIHCLTQHLNDLIKVTTGAGLIVEDVVASPLAASLPTLNTTQKAAGCVLANIGSQTTSVIVFEDDHPISLQVFPLGSDDVTRDIALGLRIPLEEAERMKLESATALNLKRKLDEIIEARLSDMFELIESHLKKLGRNGLLPAGVIIVGGGANVENLDKLAKSQLKLPAKVFDPAEVGHLKNQIRDSSWVVAYGLCLYGLADGGETPATTLGAEALGNAGRGIIKWLKELWP